MSESLSYAPNHKSSLTRTCKNHSISWWKWLRKTYEVFS